MVPLSTALAWQRDYVVGAGAPTAGLVLESIRADVLSAGPLAGVLPSTVRFGDLPGLRIMATVHRLAIERRIPAVARWLPTLGGHSPCTAADEGTFGRAVVQSLLDNREALDDGMARTPQTNETGRAALLRCALSREDRGTPVRLHEIGASAGLNLRADLLPGVPALEAGPLPPIALRRGCDLDPVDVATTEGRTLLSSYIWVDDVERFARLARAMDVARSTPAELLRTDAADFVAGMDVEAGSTTVLWHSAMWLYLPSTTRAAVQNGIRALGGRATADAPFVHVSWEWDDSGAPDAAFQLQVTRWAGTADDGLPRTIAVGRSHGEDVRLVSA